MSRKIITIDCETDPFKHGRIPQPFIWGAYDGEDFRTFTSTTDFAQWLQGQHVIAYAHNGGKFDFMYLLDYSTTGPIFIIHSRIVQLPFGNAILRDSFSIVPVGLAEYQKDKFDYSKMEQDRRQEHWKEIVHYLKADCVYLYELVMEFREIAGTSRTIAANGFQFLKKKDGWRCNTNYKFDEVFRQFYHGGRCEALRPGIYNEAYIYDINSAYPNAMCHQHPDGNEYTVFHGQPRHLEKSFLYLSCYSKGAFPKREKSKLSFPHDYSDYYVTGWEYIAAVENNLISDVTIHYSYEFLNTRCYSGFVEHWHEIKQHAKRTGNKAQYVIAKIMLCSVYGKFAQNKPTYDEYRIVEGGTQLEDNWTLDAEFGTKELHSRPCIYNIIKKHGDKWKFIPLFYNVATAASITGFVRAQLINTISALEHHRPVYVDTDGIITENIAVDLGSTGDKLGSWKFEGKAAPCYIAAKKLYAAKLSDGWKVASKGGILTPGQIKKICEGETVIWRKEAPTFGVDGSAFFMVRSFSQHREKEEYQMANKTTLPADPRKRFTIVANKRFGTALSAIRSIGNVAGNRGDKPGQYKYDDADADKIVTGLRAEIDNLASRLVHGTPKAAGPALF